MSIIASPLDDLLNARALVGDTLASLTLVTKLRELGYELSYSRDAAQRIVLADYPNSPSRPMFGSDPLMVSVGNSFHTFGGGCGTRRQRISHYNLTLPPGLGESVEYVYDLQPTLHELAATVEAFNAAHGTDYPLAQVVQLHYAYEGDIEKILVAAAAGVNGKQALDMLRLGYSHEEILQIHQLPISLIFDGAPDRRVLAEGTA